MYLVQSIYSLVLGENNQADQSRIMEQQMNGMANGMANQDISQAYKKEWEELTVQKHRHMLIDAERRMVGLPVENIEC